ncbi:MAG: tetratricopeptide repeat protein, partial [Gemmatimonadota bacterium]|nr:tetratricopeptide repeat protein [Gemmatimonadota bacterium]
PEQIQSEPIDARSDIWSVGALLFELLTGERPFAGDNYAAVLYSVIYEEAADPTEINPDIPDSVAAIIETCLTKEKEGRYEDGAELYETLRVLAGPTFGPMPPGARWRGALAGALGVVALAALLLALPPSRAAILDAVGGGLDAAETYVAVVPSRGGSPEDQILAEGLAHSLTWELQKLTAGGSGIAVLPAGEVLNLSVRTAQRVHELYQVNRVVTVAIDRIGGGNVAVELVDPREQLRQIARVDLPLPSDGRFQDSMPVALGTLLGIERTSRPELDSPDVDADAYSFYTLARGYRARYDDPTNLDNAVEQFERALAIDSGFAPAHAGLCEARFEQFRIRNDTTYVNAALPSCDQAVRLGPDLPEVMVPVAAVYLQTGNEARALGALTDVLEADSTNADAHRWLARVWGELGDIEASIAAYETAIDLNPRMWVYYTDLGGTLMYTGRYEEAASRFEMVRQLAPDNDLGDLGLSGLYMLTGRLDRAERILASLLEASAHPRIPSNMGLVHMLQGEWAAAIAILEEGLLRYPNDIFIWRWLAQAREVAGERRGAREAWERVIELTAPRVAVNTSNDDGLAILAEAYARLGQEARARQYMALLEADSGVWPYNYFYLGRTYELLGDRAEALHWIEEAVRRGWHVSNVEWDPWLEELRDDPRSERILAATRAD